jgi:hypothetical protein
LAKSTFAEAILSLEVAGVMKHFLIPTFAAAVLLLGVGLFKSKP